jgi:hypothetical protein
VSSTSAALAWTAPTPCIVINYNVYYGTDNITFTRINVGNVLNYTITGLTLNTPYYVYVTAEDNCGEGPASSHVLVAPTENPGPPRNLQTSTDFIQYFTVNWQAPAYSGSSPFSHYTLLIRYQLPPSNPIFYQNTNYTANNFNSRSVTQTGEGTYDVYVTAVNTDGNVSTTVQGVAIATGF